MKDPSKPLVDQRAQQQRRRGALSCAECRRLKLRCDRVFPCQSCKKRGCAAICPDGALTTGKGNRFILANTEELHERIEALQERITQLEGGLLTLHQQSPHAHQTHPLLVDQLLNIKTPIGAEIVGTANPRTLHRNKSPNHEGESSVGANGESEEEVTDSFGTLTLGEGSGKSRFFGIAAGAHFLLGDDQDNESEHENGLDANDMEVHENKPSLPARLSHMARSYPFSTLGKNWPAARDQLRCFLPDPHHAWSLSEQYFEHGAWLYMPVSRLYYVERIFTPIMDPNYDDPNNPTKTQPTAADYALLFIVLALGSVLNLAQPPYQPECEHYHALARAALGAEEPLADSLTAVQALLLMCFYNQLSDDKDAPARAWSISGLAYKMSFAIGLHRDGKRWNLDQEETDRRRVVFWELAMFDAWSSQALGRPPSMFNVHVDVEYPTDIPEHFDVNGAPEPSFQRNKYVYASTLIEIYDQAFGVKRPTYDVILRLDRKIRDLEVPVGLQVLGLNSNPSGPSPPAPTTRAQVMQAHTTLCIKETCLIYLHRGYLARALSEHPDDPFKSRYAASVLAAHRGSCAVLAGVRNAFSLLPRLMPRVFFLWIHAFSATIVLATIVIRSPSSNISSSSLRELDMACEMFERAKEGCRPAKVLPMLLKLRARAHTAFEESRQGKPRFLSPPIDSIEGTSLEDDLTMLGSKSRLVRVKEKHGTTAAAASPPLHSQEGDNSSSVEENSPRPAASDYHPALAEYLKLYTQQLQYQQTHCGSPGSPNELRADAMAAIAEVTSDMNALESSGSTTSAGTMGNSSGSTVFDFAYAYGLTEQKPDIGAMTRDNSNPNYQIPPYTNQQIGKAGITPQFGQDQPVDVISPQYFGGSPAQYSRHQSPLSLENDSPATSLSNPPLSDSSDSQSHSPIPPSQIPSQLQSQHSQHLPPKPFQLALSQQMQMAPTSSSATPSAQYYADTFQNPHTPFSAFEPAFMAPRRDGAPNTSAMEENGQNMPIRPSGDPGYAMASMQFPPLDMSTLGQGPDPIDLSWQLMSDLRSYL